MVFGTPTTALEAPELQLMICLPPPLPPAPPPYSTITPGATTQGNQFVQCRVCNNIIHVDPGSRSRVVKCAFCHEATVSSSCLPDELPQSICAVVCVTILSAGWVGMTLFTKTQTNRQPDKCTLMYTHAQTYRQTHAHTHTRTHTCTHTHTHTIDLRHTCCIWYVHTYVCNEFNCQGSIQCYCTWMCLLQLLVFPSPSPLPPFQPVASPPPGKKYVRCPCNCLLTCSLTATRVICPRENW